MDIVWFENEEKKSLKINKLNYFNDKKECEEFLQQFDFKYYVPELCGNDERYCVELTGDLKKIYFCSIEYTFKGKMINQDIFFDADNEYSFRDGKNIANFFYKEYGEKRNKEMQELSDFFNQKFMLASKAVEKYGLSKSTIRRAIHDGRLKDGIDCYKEGREWKVAVKKLDEMYGKTSTLKYNI